MKVAAWNVERGYRPEEACRLLAGLGADLYLLSELDRGNRRTGGVDMFALLSEALGLPGRFAQEFEELPSVWRTLIPQGGPGGGVHGNAVFSRLGLSGYRELRLPTAAPLRWDGGTLVPELFEPRRGARVAQAFEVELGGRTVSIVNTHLENWRCGWDLRRRQLEAALGEARSEHILLAGDMNPLGGILGTVTGNKVNGEVRRLREFLEGRGLTDSWQDTDYTCFNWGTRAKLDWLCVSSGLSALRTENIRTGISDHNCLVAELTMVTDTIVNR